MLPLFLLALRNVVRNRRRTIITLLALFVGVGVLVSVRGLVNGLQRTLIKSVSEGQTGAVQVHRKGYTSNILGNSLQLAMHDDILAKISHLPHVKAVSGRIAFAGRLSYGDKTLFTSVLAVEPQGELAVCPLRSTTLQPGSDFVGGPDADGVVLTEALAHAIGLARGDQAALLAPDVDGALSGENMRLAGTMHLQIAGEKKIALAPLALAQRLLKMPHQVTEVVVAVEPVEQSAEVAAAIAALLGPEYEVTTWSDVALFVRQSMERENFQATVIAVSFMLMMLVGVANTMLLSMLERTREIGTMMAMGLRRRKIVGMILMEALALGLLGGIVGSIAGCAWVGCMSWRGVEIITQTSQTPFFVHPFITASYVAQIVGIATLGSAAFAIYPAWRALRLRPVQALAGK